MKKKGGGEILEMNYERAALFFFYGISRVERVDNTAVCERGRFFFLVGREDFNAINSLFSHLENKFSVNVYFLILFLNF